MPLFDRQVCCDICTSAGLSRPVWEMVVRRLRGWQGAGEVHEHGADQRCSTSPSAVKSRRLPALLHVNCAPAILFWLCQHPLPVRQSLGRDAARVHVLGTYSAHFRWQRLQAETVIDNGPRLLCQFTLLLLLTLRWFCWIVCRPAAVVKPKIGLPCWPLTIWRIRWCSCFDKDLLGL